MHLFRFVRSASTRVLCAVAFAGVGVCTLMAASPADQFFGIDYDRWGWDPTSLGICIDNGDFPRCGNQTKSPLAYLGTAYLLGFLNDHGIEPRMGLRLLNATALSLPAALLLLFQPLGRALAAATLYFALVWATPVPLFYVPSGALEVQQGVFLGILVACSVLALQRRPAPGWPLSVATNLLVAIVLLYKDTTLPLLLGALLLVLANRSARAGLTGGVLALAVRLWVPGALLGTACQAAYNWIRYATILPSGYILDAQATSPTVAHRLEQLFWLVASPNGGLVVFWGLAVTLLAATCVLLRVRPSRAMLGYSLALVATSLVMMANVPYAFGWDAWGARYAVPFGLAFLTSSCLTLDAAAPTPAVAPRRHRMGIRRALLFAAGLIACVVAVLSLRYVAIGYQVSPGLLFGRSLFTQPACREMLAAIEAQSPDVQGLRFFRSDTYWACARARFLTDPVTLGDAQ